MPDLLLIDGGKSQLSAVHQVLSHLKLTIPILGLAKRQEELYTLTASKPLQLAHSSAVLRLFVALRNEAHRFTITFHHKRRSKTTFHSDIDQIKGIGPKKRERVLKHFKTVQNIKKATLEELSLVKGINKTDAKNIWTYFHSGTAYKSLKPK